MIRCLDCGSPDVRSRAAYRRYPLSSCTTCGLIFFTNWERVLGDHQFDDSHEDYYRRRLQDGTLHQSFTATNAARIRELLARLQPLAPDQRVLDVGCGLGEFCQVAAATGWRAVGIDLSEAATRYGREHLGLDVRRVDFFSSELSGERFGVITMFEFIEHVPQPTRFFERARELLRPGGVLYLTTPNFSSLSRRLLQESWQVICDGHVAYFTASVLRQKLEGAGFRVESLAANNVAVATARQVAEWVREFGRGPSPDGPSGVSAPQPAPQLDSYKANQQLRARIAGSRVLTAGKELANRALSLAELGDKLIVTATVR